MALTDQQVQDIVNKYRPTLKTYNNQSTGSDIVRSKNYATPEEFLANFNGASQQPSQESGSFANTISNVAIGAGKGVLNTARNTSDFIRKGLEKVPSEIKQTALMNIPGAAGIAAASQVGRGLSALEENLGAEKGALTTPEGTAQKVGFGAEQIGEFFIPGGAATKAGKVAQEAKILSKLPNFVKKGAELLARAGTEAATTGGITALQGGSEEDIKSVAGISAALPIAGAVTGKVTAPIKKYLSEKLAPRMINSILRPAAKEFSFGKNPGLGVAKEGLTAKTREGLLKQISSKKQVLGQEIDNLLTTQGKEKTIDVTKLLTPLDEAMEQAVKSGEQVLYNRLQGVKDGLTKTFKATDGKIEASGTRNLVLSPKEVAQLKREIGNSAKWTGQAFDNEVNQVRVGLYRALNDAVEEAVPGAKQLQQRYANMLSAEKSLEKTIDTVQKQGLVGLKDIGIGATLGLGTSLGEGDSGLETALKTIIFTGLGRGARTTFVQSNLAKQLSKLAPQEKTILSQAVPLLRNIFLGSQSPNLEK